MSCFIVSKRHIDALVAARRKVPSHEQPEYDLSPDSLGRMLWQENMRSVADRYPDHGKLSTADEILLSTYRYDPKSADGLPVIALIKAIHAYTYQASEHRGWEESRSRRYCEALEHALVRMVPGYDSAAWGIP